MRSALQRRLQAFFSQEKLFTLKNSLFLGGFQRGAV